MKTVYQQMIHMEAIPIICSRQHFLLFFFCYFKKQNLSWYYIIFTFPLRVFKWTFTFEMWFIPSWTTRFKPHPHTHHLSGLRSSPSNNVACLLTFAWRWTRIAMTWSAENWRFGFSKPDVMSELIQISGKPAKLDENWYLTDNIKCKYK